MRSKFLLSILLVSFPLFAQQGKLDTKNIVIENAENQKITLNVEIADTNEKRTYGLMNRKSLPQNGGMLFIFSKEQYLNFWMKNTYIPLSIAYIDAHGIIRDIMDMAPLDTSLTYPSKYPAKFALEVNKGYFEKNKITVGCYVKIDSGR